MTTKNIRIVGYLPPAIHQQLRQYMTTHSLTESAALVQIVKQFFNDRPTENPIELEIDTLKTEVAGLKQRLSSIEAALNQPRRSSVRSSTAQYTTPILPPQTLPQLARRLGVGTETLAEAAGKGEAYFKDWSQSRDPMKRAWVERDGRFHPVN
jgi:hypothetical protein